MRVVAKQSLIKYKCLPGGILRGSGAKPPALPRLSTRALAGRIIVLYVI